MRHSSFILLLVVAIFATATILAFKAPNRFDPRPQSKETLEERLKRLPITDFDAPEPIDAEKKLLRQARNSRHNSSVTPEGVKPPVLSEIMETVLVDLPLSNQRQEPPIPVAQSNAVVIGTVRDTRAYLSGDKTGVYSEIVISVEDVLKTDTRCSLRSGDTIDAERWGGAVRFPSGKILRRAFLGRGIPISGHRYLLFLTYNEDGKDFSIVTGYELTRDQVVPLDGTATLEKGGRFEQFSGYEAYAGTPLTSFLAEVRAAIAHVKPL